MSLPRRVLTLCTALFLAACASAGGSNGSSGNRAVLTRQELGAEVGRTLEDVIRQRRPQWLNRRGSSTLQDESDIVVYQDGTRMGGPTILRTIPADVVESARFLTAAEATTRFGTGHTHGAIVVVMRR